MGNRSSEGETRREKQVAASRESATRRRDGRTETEAAELVAAAAAAGGDGELFAERIERRGGARITRTLRPEASGSGGREDK
jgi:hypothetical protein